MLVLDLSQTIDLLAMLDSVHWYGNVLRMEDDHVFIRALYFEVEGQRRKIEVKRDIEKAGRGGMH